MVFSSDFKFKILISVGPQYFLVFVLYCHFTLLPSQKTGSSPSSSNTTLLICPYQQLMTWNLYFTEKIEVIRRELPHLFFKIFY